MEKVLLIDDDQDIYKLVKTFAKNDFQLDHAPSLKDAQDYFQDKAPEVVVLDIELEDGNGIDFLVKNQHLFEERNISVIMLSKQNQLNRKLESFELGAIDFINKPFEPMELMARIKSSLKRKASTSKSLIKKDITLELLSGRAYITNDGQKQQLDLSPTEFKLLLLMLKNEDQVYSREQLIENIWSENINITDRTIDQHISKLRKKLTSKFYGIKTKHGLGYSLGLLQPGDLK